MVIPILFSVFFLFIGVGLLVNVGGRPEKYHAIMRLAWDRMDRGAMNQGVRVFYLYPGRAPFWAFRYGGAAFCFAAGTLGLVSLS